MNGIRVFWGVLLMALGMLYMFGKGKRTGDGRREEKRSAGQRPDRELGEFVILSGAVFLLRGVWPWAGAHGLATALIAWGIVTGVDVWRICRRRHDRSVAMRS